MTYMLLSCRDEQVWDKLGVAERQQRIMGTTFGAVALTSTLAMALGPVAGGWLYDAFGSYFWMFVDAVGIGLGP